jgi:hypothetical protein
VRFFQSAVEPAMAEVASISIAATEYNAFFIKILYKYKNIVSKSFT